MLALDKRGSNGVRDTKREGDAYTESERKGEIEGKREKEREKREGGGETEGEKGGLGKRETLGQGEARKGGGRTNRGKMRRT